MRIPRKGRIRHMRPRFHKLEWFYNSRLQKKNIVTNNSYLAWLTKLGELFQVLAWFWTKNYLGKIKRTCLKLRLSMGWLGSWGKTNRFISNSIQTETDLVKQLKATENEDLDYTREIATCWSRYFEHGWLKLRFLKLTKTKFFVMTSVFF